MGTKLASLYGRGNSWGKEREGSQIDLIKNLIGYEVRREENGKNSQEFRYY